jgi:hypothetical protein
MKKILALMVLCTLSMGVSAQELESLQSESISVDSLATKLDKLQHDYDFLYCKYELDRIVNELRLWASEITIASNSLSINLVDGGFSIDLYTSFKNRHDAAAEFISSYIDNIVSVKNVIRVKKASSSFSEMEILLLSNYNSVIDSLLGAAEAALEHFKVVLDSYKKLG